MENFPVHATDLFVIAVILISALIALARGLVHEVLSVLGWVGAFVVTLYAFEPLSPVVRTYIQTTWIADAVTIVGVFVVTLILLSYFSRRISKTVQKSALNVLDRSSGFLFGLLRGAVAVILVFMVFDQFYEKKEDRPKWLTEARTLPLIEQGAVLIVDAVPETVKERTRAFASDVEDKIDNEDKDKKDSERLLERFTSPAPKGAASGEQSGYKKRERKDMDRLLQNTK